jgi:hypothetical protein
MPDAELCRMVVDAIFRLAVLTAGLAVFRPVPFGIVRALQRLEEGEQSVAGMEADWVV